MRVWKQTRLPGTYSAASRSVYASVDATCCTTSIVVSYVVTVPWSHTCQSWCCSSMRRYRRSLVSVLGRRSTSGYVSMSEAQMFSNTRLCGAVNTRAPGACLKQTSPSFTQVQAITSPSTVPPRGVGVWAGRSVGSQSHDDWYRTQCGSHSPQNAPRTCLRRRSMGSGQRSFLASMLAMYDVSLHTASCHVGRSSLHWALVLAVPGVVVSTTSAAARSSLPAPPRSDRLSRCSFSALPPGMMYCGGAPAPSDSALPMKSTKGGADVAPSRLSRE